MFYTYSSHKQLPGLKTIVKKFFHQLGFRISKLPKSYAYHVNAYTDQQMLVRNQSVRVIFDLGANVGNTAKEYHQLFPQADIYAFEPSENAFASLSKTGQEFNSIKPYQLAVAEASGEERFYLNQASMTNSLLEVSQDSNRYVDPQLTENLGTVNVSTVTLDEFCQQENINNIDILKMDIQGGEVKALTGATQLLAKQSIKLVYCEVLFAHLYEKQAYFWDVGNFLQQYGYIFFGFYNPYYSKCGSVMWGDAIFLSREIEKDLTN
jgi:FkbM family methyltransferase